MNRAEESLKLATRGLRGAQELHAGKAMEFPKKVELAIGEGDWLGYMLYLGTSGKKV